MGILAEYAHPIEVLIANVFQTTFGLPFLATTFHPHTATVWLCLRVHQTSHAHSGYSFCNTLLEKVSLVNGKHAIFHDHHHTSNQGNFGTYYLDWIFGTMDHFVKNGLYEGYKLRKAGKIKDI